MLHSPRTPHNSMLKKIPLGQPLSLSAETISNIESGGAGGTKMVSEYLFPLQ